MKQKQGKLEVNNFKTKLIAVSFILLACIFGYGIINNKTYAAETSVYAYSASTSYVRSVDEVVIKLQGIEDKLYKSNTLTADKITIKVGDVVVTPSTKMLTAQTAVLGMPRYDLKLSGITGNGALKIVISDGTISDDAGNLNNINEWSTPVIVDNAAPTAGTMTMKLGSSSGANYSNNTWTNQSIYVAVNNGSDTGSGHKSTTYTVDGGTAQTAAQTITAQGTHTIVVTTVDNAGNSATRTYTVKIDKTVPTISVSPTTSPVAKTTNVKIVVGESGGSGLLSTNSYQYQLGTSNTTAPTGTWTTYSSASTGTTATLGSGLTGTYYLWIKEIKDTAGNASTATGSTKTGTYHVFGTYIFDNAAPTVAFSPNGNTTYAKSQSSVVKVTDSGAAGVNTSSLKYQWTQSTTAPAESTFTSTFTNGGTVTKSDGTGNNWYLWILTKDTLGNTIITKSNVFYLDNSAPTFTSYEVKNVTTTGYDVYVYGVADSNSGVKTLRFPTWTSDNGQDDLPSSWSTNAATLGTNWGNGTWYYRVNVTDHKNEYGTYNTHVYLYDNLENAKSFSVNNLSTGTLPNVPAVNVTYDNNDGSNIKTVVQKGYGAKLGTLGVLTKTGYIFDGWFTAVTGGTKISSDTTVPANDVTYYGHWTPITYTVAYNGNGATGGSTANSSHTYDTAKILTANGYTRTGYTFIGWGTSNSQTSATYSNSQSVTNLSSTNNATVTVYALWKKTITLTLKDYNNQTRTQSKDIYNATTTATFTGLTQNAASGWTARGWSTSSTGNASVAIGNSGSLTLNDNATYYGSYQSTITATFYYHSGTDQYANTQTSATATGTRYMNYVGTYVQSNITVPTSVTGSTGYYGATYKGVAVGTNSASAVTPTTANTNYYAFYQCNVTFWYYNTSATEVSQVGVRTSVSNGSAYVVSGVSNVPSPGAYNGGTYKGWTYQNTTIVDSTRTPEGTAVVTLYAYYQKSYTVTYNANSGTGAPAVQSGTCTMICKGSTINPSITLSTTKPTRSGYTFIIWTAASNGTGTTYSPGGSITLTGSITIYAKWLSSTGPSNVSVKEGVVASFTTMGTNATSYQWYKATSSTGAGTAISGATSATYSIPAASVLRGINGTYYYCVVNNSANTAATYTTGRALLTVYWAHTISTQPASHSTNEGTATSFTVACSGGNGSIAGYTYQWYKNTTSSTTGGVLITGVTSATYSIPAASALRELNNTYYYCITSNGQYSITSSVVGLTVYYPPTVTGASNTTKKEGDTATFSVSASGGNPSSGYTYQWYKTKDEAPENYDGFNINKMNETDGSFYRVNFSKTSGTDNSWYYLKFANYSFEVGKKYRIHMKIRMQSATNDSKLELRHSAISNDYGTTGIQLVRFDDATKGSWIEYTLDRSFDSTVILNGTTYTTTPMIEIYTGNLALTSVVTSREVTFDYKDVYVEEVDTGKVVMDAGGSAISGATASSYSFNATTSLNQTGYYCIVNNGKMSTTSGTGILTSGNVTGGTTKYIKHDGGTVTLTPTKSGAAGTLNWSTSNSTNAKLSATTGNSVTVTAGSTAGNYTVTATDAVTGASTTYTIKVTSITSYVGSASVKSMILDMSGTKTQTITTTGTNQGTVTYTSSNTGVASVNSSTGVVTGVANGSCTITATESNGGATATVSVTVQTSPTAITLNKTSLAFNGANKATNQTLSVTYIPTTANVNKTITWTSSNTGVVTVSSGSVKAIADGTATITARTANGKTATCSVRVDTIGPIIGASSKAVTSATTYNVSVSNVTDAGSGVAGYYISTSSTAPTTSSTWISSTSSSYTFTGKAENTTYYVWAKDAYGNISSAKSIATYSINYSVGNGTTESAWTEEFAAAVSTASSGNAIKVLKNVTDSSSGTVSKNLTLNLNGKTLTRTTVLTVNSGVVFNLNGSSGTLTTSLTTGNFITVNGTLNVSGGITITGTNSISDYLINNVGTMNVSSFTGDIKRNQNVIYSSKTLSISSGTISATDNAAVTNASTGNLTITGGTFVSGSTTIYNTSTGATNITGATITSTGDSAVTNSGSGTVTINADSAITGYNYGVLNNESGTVEVKGGTVKATGENCKVVANEANSAETNNPTLKLSGGTIQTVGSGTSTGTSISWYSDSSCVYNNYESGVVNVFGSTITTGEAKNAFGIANLGSLTITSGTIKSNSLYAVHTDGQADISGSSTLLEYTGGSNISCLYTGGNTIMSGGKITSNGHAVGIDSGTLKTTGGTIENSSTGYAAVSIRNQAKAEFKNTTIKATGMTASSPAIDNVTGNAANCIIRSDAYGFGVSGYNTGDATVQYSINGKAIATTNNATGSSYEVVALYNAGSAYSNGMIFQSATESYNIFTKVGTTSKGTGIANIYKSEHGGATGTYAVVMYSVNPSTGQTGSKLAEIPLTF